MRLNNKSKNLKYLVTQIILFGQNLRLITKKIPGASWGILLVLSLFLPNLTSFLYAAPHEGNKTSQSEEEDYSPTPFTDYGEFNEASDEEADAKFFQFGRFFGVSLGLGSQFLDGHRGALWEGGFPTFDFKVHYWFDFNIALDLGFMTSANRFKTAVQNLNHVDVNMLHAGLDVKYYFDTKNLSAPVSFASPYIAAGFGSYTKTQNSNSQQTQDIDTSVGLCFGGGLEFVISPKKTYFEIEGKMHLVTFKDTYTTIFSPIGLDDLTGNFYTVTGNILFTW